MAKNQKNLQNIQTLKELINNYSNANIGLEKESLRFSSQGISKKIHPVSLGSSLTNKFFTTDFSEALLEFVSPPYSNRGDELLFMENAHHFVHLNIGEEKLWPFSVAPYTLDDDIPIAKYGESNLAKFKELYRRGLSERYSKAMQIIAGIHFNYSFNERYIGQYNQITGQSLTDSKNQIYLNTIRNIYRNNWLLLYLFGSSPVISNTLLKNNNQDAINIDGKYSYFPYATSLRMSDLGYQNIINRIEVSLESIEKYSNSLIRATNKFCKSFSYIHKESQINSNVLQIEDEYYSAARPKNSIDSHERLAKKLVKQGIEYVELRSIDIDPFKPVGIDQKTLFFLEVFMIFCSVKDSPNISKDELNEIKKNDLFVSKYGRNIESRLYRSGKKINLQSYAREILDEMLSISNLLDTKELKYSKAIEEKIIQISNPSLLPSSVFLDKFFSSKMSYFDFGSSIAEINKSKFMRIKANNNNHFNTFKREAKQSSIRTEELENKDSISFDAFLKNYFKC